MAATCCTFRTFEEEVRELNIRGTCWLVLLELVPDIVDNPR